jgi:integrase
MRLNEQVIKETAAPLKGGYILIRDHDERGFALRVTEKNVRSFVLCYSIDGRERRLTIGRWPTWSVTAARLKARELRRRIDAGEDPLEQKRARREAPTVEEIAREYVERHAAKKKSGKTLGEYLNRDVLPVWGKWKAADVERRHVIELVERKALDTPIAGNMLLGVVRGMFNWAIKNEVYKGQNPASQVDPPAPKKERDRWLTEEEIRQFWTKLDSAKMAPECRTALRLILITAQRSGEVLSAERTELDLDTAWWLIPSEKSKNGLQHSVPLSGLALAEIKKLEGEGRWLIPSWYTDSHMTVAGLSNALAENQEHFGLARFTPHDLRRTAATHLTKTCGVSQFVVGKILNHSEKSVTAVYDRYAYDPEKKAALEKWERELRRILGAPIKAKLVELKRAEG